ncbi:hypothetical protein L1987_06545 [Smallanthus sonchifolius]|uniref:Uncharacterized protein n=1 Tax=Smallanthus sonchifolius TaxID=185202 RepID=A0ACB9JYH9_9ASTR|nr:hypothetical protein L1987_06545 [Smallanthus sonchifolius]
MSEEEGYEEQVVGDAENSDSESTESDSSDSDDAPSQAHPRRLMKVTLPESSSKRKRQETSSEYEPDSDSDAAIQRRRKESINKQRGIGHNKLSFVRRRPRVTPDVAITAIAEEVPVIVSLPVPSIQVAVTTPILTESVTITPTTIQTTTIPTSIPITTLQHISEPFHELDFTHGFDFDEIFTFPTDQAKASSSRGPNPRDTQITTLETQFVSLLEMV